MSCESLISLIHCVLAYFDHLAMINVSCLKCQIRIANLKLNKHHTGQPEIVCNCRLDIKPNADCG